MTFIYSSRDHTVKFFFYIYFLEPNKSNKNDVGKKKTRNWLNFESEEEEEEENILISQYSRQSQS